MPMPLSRRDISALASIAGSGPAASLESGVDISWLSKQSGSIPSPLFTLHDIDFDSQYTLAGSGTAVNSPRSAYVLLRNGLSVPLVSAVDPSAVRRQASLEGLCAEAAALRLEAENERRKHRLHVVHTEYEELCAQVTTEAVVETVREFLERTFLHSQTEMYQVHRLHSHGRSSSANNSTSPTRESTSLSPSQARRPQTSMELQHESFAPVGPKSHHYLDDMCIDAAGRARGRAVADIRRVLRQKELKTQQAAAREHVVYQNEKEAIERTKELRERERLKALEHLEALREKDKQFKDRFATLKEHEKSVVKNKASKIQQRDSAVTDRIEAIKAYRNEANIAIREVRKSHRDSVKQKDDEQQYLRREQLIRAAEEATRKHEVAIERRRDEAVTRNNQKACLSQALKETVKEASLFEKARLEYRRDAVAREAEERHRAFQERRELRLKAQQEHNRLRANRSKFSRDVAERKHNVRLAEIKSHYEERIQTVEGIKRDKEKEGKVQQEALSQMRASKREEQRRVDRASEFAFIGYVADNEAKALAVQHEKNRRNVLTNHVRSEREALMRATQRTLLTIDAENAVRMKDECSALNQM